MGESLIDQARERKAQADRRADEAQAVVEQATKESREWQDFIEKAESLAIPQYTPPGVVFKRSNGSRLAIEVKRGTWPAKVAELIRNTGPLSMPVIAAHFAPSSPGSPNLKTIINTAVWRRKDDLFEKKDDGLWHLRAKDFVLVD
jgi:hypothetical protein